jgi:hypothetical protein
VREGAPEKGDLRYPTLGGTIFVGVFLALAAAVLGTWLTRGKSFRPPRRSRSTASGGK